MLHWCTVDLLPRLVCTSLRMEASLVKKVKATSKLIPALNTQMCLSVRPSFPGCSSSLAYSHGGSSCSPSGFCCLRPSFRTLSPRTTFLKYPVFLFVSSWIEALTLSRPQPPSSSLCHCFLSPPSATFWGI